MTSFSTQTRLRVPSREVNRLTVYGFALADEEPKVYISRTKLQKFIRDTIAHHGHSQAETQVRALIEHERIKQIPSYERALRTSSVSTI